MNEADTYASQKNNGARTREENGPAEASLFAVLWNRDAAVEALNERRLELALSFVELDEAAEQAPGTAAKYLGPGQIISLGVGSLFTIAHALGLRIVAEVDPRATEALLEQCRPGNPRQVRLDNLAQRPGKRALLRAMKHMNEFSWSEILKAIHAAKRAAAAEREAKAAVEENKQRGARQPNGNGRTSAYDAPIGDELEQIADAASIRDQHAINRRTQAMLLSKRPKAAAAAR